MKYLALLSAVALVAITAPTAAAPTDPQAWKNRKLSADARANLLVKAMTLDEKLVLVTGYFGVQNDWNLFRFPEARRQSAGFVPGVPRLGFTPQWQTDAGSGVATQGVAPADLERTALPAGILTASTWNPQLAQQAGAMIGSEARNSGFNEMLAGGVNLLREPGNGRNFEYGGEDPLLAGMMVGSFIRGIQSNMIVSTIKHYALNDQETGRNTVNVLIDEPAARMSDLLAFQIAIEQGNPGSVMCSYNLVNGVHACQNGWLNNTVLKGDWGYDGFVMSDWGAQHDAVRDALGGLDQETGVAKQDSYVWREKLKAAVQSGQVPAAVLDDKARRIASALIRVGAVDNPVKISWIDFAANERVAQADAEEGIVLLKNDGNILPLAQTARTIAIVGGHADAGVLTGGGSAQVYPRGGTAVKGEGPKSWPGPIVYGKSSPSAALAAERPGARVLFDPGTSPAAAAALAKTADVAIVFVTQWTAESLDFPMALPDNQDAVVEAVARANPRTIVVLETGGPVLMPWADRVSGIVEAWYPGTRGGQAIARVLSGAVNPSGKLPATFGRAAEDYPRATIAGKGLPEKQVFDVSYTEGAAVGYKWFEKTNKAPLFPFGHGLSYTSFVQDQLTARQSRGVISATFRVRNSGQRAGKHVAQVYVAPVAGGWEAPKRLGAFQKVSLAPGGSETVSVTIDPRLLSTWDQQKHAFRVAGGSYRVILAKDAMDPGQSVTVKVPARYLSAGRGRKK
ncbi:glycoside hydrolase family 3 C-terminal domain-containing protein [uncultured Sphingomonas sp.]|uniref:beta-glucosidase n=1 Tax=uncultured Sphingomonas sp. TaxID=158754 RepID=UPI0025D823BF|nr:glycoside hydrolase family 3 C-terminal domain-containing protein [uncultured Sphingomonas sp.]